MTGNFWKRYSKFRVARPERRRPRQEVGGSTKLMIQTTFTHGVGKKFHASKGLSARGSVVHLVSEDALTSPRLCKYLRWPTSYLEIKVCAHWSAHCSRNINVIQLIETMSFMPKINTTDTCFL